jgi:regulator of PEP synthase PpsR (kinase-PPPase family)
MDDLVKAIPPPAQKPQRRTVFFVSDRTGITAEMLGNSMLVQFDQFQFDRRTIPFVDSTEKVEEVILQINQVAERDGQRPIVFTSIVDEEAAEHVRSEANALTLDVFQVFISPLEAELKMRSSHTAGRSHGIANSHEYFARMEAINFTQAHDDGATTRDLAKAQVILVGVSRCGKTPTSLYLALQFGIRTANFPLTPDDFVDRKLPHDPARAVARDPRGAAPQQSLRLARELPARSARGGAPDGARAHRDGRYDDQVDRGNRDDDPAPHRPAAHGVLTRRCKRRPEGQRMMK